MTFVREFRQLSPSGARNFWVVDTFLLLSLFLWALGHGEGRGGERSFRVDHVHPHTHTPFFPHVRDALVSGLWQLFVISTRQVAISEVTCFPPFNQQNSHDGNMRRVTLSYLIIFNRLLTCFFFFLLYLTEHGCSEWIYSAKLEKWSKNPIPEVSNLVIVSRCVERDKNWAGSGRPGANGVWHQSKRTRYYK